MSNLISVSAQIPKELGEMLTKVSGAEERDISYYIIEGLDRLLREKLEDLEDYEDAKKAYEEFVASGEEAVPWDEMKKELKL